MLPDSICSDVRQAGSAFVDPLVLTTRTGEPTNALRDILAGRPSFLVCGGPSASNLDLSQLRRPGIWSLGVNNAAAAARTNAFICADPPSKFSHSIWLNPQVRKFVPTVKLSRHRGRLRRKVDCRFEFLPLIVSECPEVWGFARRSYFLPDDSFFTDPAASWGNNRAASQVNGQPRTLSTMLLAIRLLYYLGSRRIYLIGVDFNMSVGNGYFFCQNRSSESCVSNNNAYIVLNKWLCTMQANGVFNRFGLEIYNCNRYSGLRAFPYVSFEDAIVDAKGMVEDEPDLSGWYDRC